jgi:ribosome biogenesis GTPase A
MATRLALMRIARMPGTRTFALATVLRRKHYSPTIFTARNNSITRFQSWRSFATQAEQSAVTPSHCSGCGAELQDSDATAVGYYSLKATHINERQKSSNDPKMLSEAEYEQRIGNLDAEMKQLLGIDTEETQVLENKPQITARKLCSRCHSLTHHKTSATTNSKEFLRSTLQHSSLSFLKTKNNALIVAVFDIGDIPFSIEPLVKHLTSNPTHRIMLVANKVDILPKKALNHQQRIQDWLGQQAKKNRIPTSSIVDINLVSAVKGWGIKSLLSSIQDHCNSTDDVYVLGCTNVGKSALVNAFLKQGAAKKEDVSDYAKQHTARVRREFQVTTSNIPGTTIGSIKIPLRVLGIHNQSQNTNNRFVTKDHYMVDTPGVVDENQLVHMVPANQLKKWELRKELKPVTYRLDVGEYLYTSAKIEQ